MSKSASPKLIGAFVLGAIVLVVGGVLALGGGKLFHTRTPVVMFFQGSVAGLNVGSPVNFRGVKVGQVTNVFIRYTAEGKASLEIPVFAEFSTDNVQIVGTTDEKTDEKKEVRHATDARLKMLVGQGLRAQLALPSLVTGQATISLDFFPGTPTENASAYPERLQIPTVPSTLQEVQATLQQVYGKISQLPLDELVEDARSVMKGADRLVNDPALAQAATQAGQTMTEMQRVARTLNSRVGPLLASLEAASATARQTLKAAQDTLAGTEVRSRETFQKVDAMLQAAQKALAQAETTLKTVDGVIEPGGAVNYQAVEALRQTTAAARSLRELADQLRRSPDALLFGRPAGGDR